MKILAERKFNWIMIRNLVGQRLIFVQNVLRPKSFFKVKHLRSADIRLYCLTIQYYMIVRSICVFGSRIRVKIDQEFALETIRATIPREKD